MTMELFYSRPDKIKVREDLVRTRVEMGDITGLLTSIIKFGQIVPIIVTRDLELIDGGRRLAACILGDHDVLCVYHDDVNDYELRELELESNIQRKQFTAAEEASAIAELHRLKQDQYGSPNTFGGWSIKQTAELIDRSERAVHRQLENAKAIVEFPELKGCKTSNQIAKQAKKLKKFKEAVENLASIPAESEKYEIYNTDCLVHMKTLKDNTVDILLTDPPYGIDINETAKAQEDDDSHTQETFNDSKDYAFYLNTALARESFRFCKPDAHAYIFIAPEFFSSLREIYIEAGWEVWYRPMIWVKNKTGNNNAPHRWPSSQYEAIMYMRKPHSTIYRQMMPDIVHCDVVANKLHYAEKPVQLIVNLLSRVALPGAVVYDPFTGSGAIMEAAIKENCYPIGCDNDLTFYGLALERLSKLC